MTLLTEILKNKISIIINYYKTGDFNKVIDEAERLLRKEPDTDFLWNILGLAFQNTSNYHKAETSFVRALQINTKNLSATNNLANNYKYIYDFDKAEEYFQKSLKIKPDHISSLVNYGNLKFELNKFEESLHLLNKALLIDSKIILIHINLSLAYQAIGNFKKAINHLKIINTLDPNYTKADKMLSALINYNDEQEHFDLMKNKIKSLKLDVNQKIYLNFALSKAFEDKKDFFKSFEHFEIGNSLKRDQSKYSIDDDKLLFSKIKSIFTSTDLDKLSITPSTKNVIFILGMPRSGTTLVEQIVSSHKNVFGAGELNYLSRLIYKNLFNGKSLNIFSDGVTSDNSKLSIIAENYSKYLSYFKFKENFITDKALLNFQWIGFIKILFPNAKIINCTRNPEENCLSIYKNLFDYEGAWCYNKDELTEYYSLYLDLMNFWETKYPDTIINIKYEDLVHSPDGEIKKLIDSLNIEWDENCLKFYQNKNAIKTLSVNQARRKIYSTSLNLYENYKPFLKKFFTYFG